MAINGSRKIRIRQKQSKVKPYTARSDTGWWNHILLFPMATDGKSCSCISDRSLYAGGWLQAVYSYTVVPSSKTQYSHTGQKRSRLSTVITPPGGGKHSANDPLTQSVLSVFNKLITNRRHFTVTTLHQRLLLICHHSSKQLRIQRWFIYIIKITPTNDSKKSANKKLKSNHAF